MQNAKTNRVEITPPLNKFVFPAFILFFLAAAGLIYYGSAKGEVVSLTLVSLSQSALEEQYGLKVNLISLTAAGGMVDLRLKIVDGEKAKILLQDRDNFPSLHIRTGNTTLSVPEDTKSQEIDFNNGVSVFLLYPNAGNAVRPGSLISIRFGDIALEPIEVR